MKVQVLSVDGDKVRFLVGSVDVAFANALRRTNMGMFLSSFCRKGSRLSTQMGGLRGQP